MEDRISELVERGERLWLAMLQHLADLYGLPAVDRLEAVALTRLEDELGEAVDRWIEANAESDDELTPKTPFQNLLADYQALAEALLDCVEDSADLADLLDGRAIPSGRTPAQMSPAQMSPAQLSIEDFLAFFESGGPNATRHEDGSLEIRFADGRGYRFTGDRVRRLD